MLRKLKATILAFIIITAALPLTAYAEVDREAVKDALFTHLWSEASLDHEMGGEYLERAQDNPYAALYYYYYITPFVDESSEETLENLDLSDSTSYSINRFVRNYYAEWEAVCLVCSVYDSTELEVAFLHWHCLCVEVELAFEPDS